MGLIIGIGNNRGGALVKPIIVDTLPTASADTMNKVYLVPSNSDTDMFDVYYTVESGGSYSWEQDGTVSREGFEIADNLTTNDATKALSAKQGKVLADAGAATAAEVTALGHEVGGLDAQINGESAINIQETISATSGVRFSFSTKYDINLPSGRTYEMWLADTEGILPRGRIIVQFYDANTNVVNVTESGHSPSDSIIFNSTHKIVTLAGDVSKYALYTGSSDTPTKTDNFALNFSSAATTGIQDKLDSLDLAAVKVTSQLLTESEKKQARDNIGAAPDGHDKNALLYDGSVLNVLYSQISGIPGNTLAHFKDGIKRGFNGIKADMRMTSDSKIVLCHDEGYTLDGNGRITTFDSLNNTPIHDLTEAQVLALEFAEQVDGQYVHPCSLDDFLQLVKKYGVVPYITIRWDSYRDDTLAGLYALLKHYSLVDKVIINLFTGSVQWATKLQNTDPALMSCNTLGTTTELSTSIIDDCYDWGCNFVCVNYSKISSITDALINYAYSKGVRVWVYQIHTAEEFDECLAKGVVGFQNYSRTAVFTRETIE